MWYLRVYPPAMWGIGQREVMISLKTPDLAEARRIRDRYLIPLLAETQFQAFREELEERTAKGRVRVAAMVKDLLGTAGRSTGLTLAELGGQFIVYKQRERAIGPATVAKYGNALAAAGRILGADVLARSVTQQEAVAVRDALMLAPRNYLRTDEPIREAEDGEARLNANTVQNIVVALRAVFKWGINEGKLRTSANPFDNITIPRRRARHRRPPTLAEADALMSLPAPVRVDALTWRAMPLLGRYTGCRAGELSQLTAEDVIEVRGVRCLHVRAAVKTESSRRLVPVAERIAGLVGDMLLARPTGLLLLAGDYTGKGGVIKRAHSYLKHFNRRAKSVAPDLSFHCLRSFCNDSMASASVDMVDRERLLGHASTRTQASYMAVDVTRLLAAVNAIP
jgi:integrase